MPKRRNLRTKMQIGIFIFTLVLSVCICFSMGIQYWQNKVDEYEKLAFSYARAAADFIDGERALSYLETNTKDDYYMEVQKYLNAIQKQSNVRYYYVFVPCEDDVVYIWDADNEEGACPLGYHEDYMEGGKEAMTRIFCENPEEKILISRDDDNYGSIAVACSPIFNSLGSPVAVVGVDLSMSGVERVIALFLLRIMAIMLLVVIASMAVFYFCVTKQLVHPIHMLNEAAKNMVCSLEQGRAFDVDIHTGDEIEELRDSFVRMDEELRDYIQKLMHVTAEKERIGAELSVATQIQADMLPCIFPPFPDRKEFDIYASMTPAKEVGGDFYDFFLLDDNHLAMVIADVSGKGVPAALFMVISKTLIKNQAQVSHSPKEILEKVNNLLYTNNKEGMFVTVWIGIMEIATGKITAANAGHEYPAIRKADGEFSLLKDKHGMVVGVMEDMIYTEYEMEIEEGGCLFVYTDGVPEATNADSQLFGTDRMVEALNRNPSAPPRQLLVNVKSAVDGFVGEAPQFDDLTMLAVERKVLQV